MTAERDDGGPAFPTHVSADAEGGLNHGMPGMTLLDWFAGQALAGLLAFSPEEANRQLDPKAAAKEAFDMANAMLAARK